MEFETAMQTAARLGVTVRAVQKWAKEGKLEGAKKVGRDWMIPFGATVLAANGKRAGENQGIAPASMPFPLFQVPYTSGNALEYIKTISDEDRRNMSLIQLYYFMGEVEESIKIAKPYLDSPNLNYRVATALFYVFANIGTGNINEARLAADILNRELENCDLTNKDEAKNNALKIFAAVVLKVQLHLPLDNVPLIEDYIKYMPEGLRIIACYLSAYKAYLAKDYERSLGIAQTAVNCATQNYPVSIMYCYIICAIDYINLMQLDKAAEYINKAWEIAHRHRAFMPFVEHYSLLQGLMESNFKKTHPKDFEKILNIARVYNASWYLVYNEKNKGKISFELTPTEFTIAMLYSRKWRVKEIAAHMHISERTVTNYIQVIYEKLNINSRKDLEGYVLG